MNASEEIPIAFGPDSPTQPDLRDLDDEEEEESWEVLTEHGTRLAPGD